MLGTVPRAKCSGAQTPVSPEGSLIKNKEAGEGGDVQRKNPGGL